MIRAVLSERERERDILSVAAPRVCESRKDKWVIVSVTVEPDIAAQRRNDQFDFLHFHNF